MGTTFPDTPLQLQQRHAGTVRGTGPAAGVPGQRARAAEPTAVGLSTMDLLRTGRVDDSPALPGALDPRRFVAGARVVTRV